MVPGGWEWLIIIAVLLLLFGAKRLPDMARSIGQSARVFKGEMKGLKSDEETRGATDGEQKQADQQPGASGTTPAPPAALPQAQDTSQNGQASAKTAQPDRGTNSK